MSKFPVENWIENGVSVHTAVDTMKIFAVQKLTNFVFYSRETDLLYTFRLTAKIHP